MNAQHGLYFNIKALTVYVPSVSSGIFGFSWKTMCFGIMLFLKEFEGVKPSTRHLSGLSPAGGASEVETDGGFPHQQV